MLDVSRAQFEDLVGEALDTIPPGLTSLMSNCVVLVEDDVAPGTPSLLGLYEGTPLTQRDHGYVGVLPDRITVFRRPTLAMCRDLADVVAEVRITVIHEVAHHFGIEDDRLHELGWA
jgi:predicted Zn-dependent protease with MMP-like domain